MTTKEKLDKLDRMTESPGKRMLSMLKRFEPEIQRALPQHLNADRMARIVTTAIRTNPTLATCTPTSFFGSVIQASQLGLEVNTPSGHAFLIPFGKECQLIIGYKGFIELAYRSKLVTKIIAREVREGDDFEYAFGTDDYIKHKPAQDPQRESRPITHTYAIVKIKDGDTIFSVLTKAEIDARKDRSASAKTSFSPWKSDYCAMAKKSAVRAIAAYIPQSPELARAESLEVSHDLGTSQSFDPEITEIFDGEKARNVESESTPVDEPPADVDLPKE